MTASFVRFVMRVMPAARWGCAVVAVLIVASLPAAADAPAGRPEVRIALVIGDAAYQNAPHLANPVNDARAIGEALRRLNFEVSELYDADLRQLTRGVRQFGIRAQDADVAVVYYAGHGVQVDGENYLLPVDTRLERPRDLLYEAMPLSNVLGEISQASKVGILLLDACRNNPFVERATRAMPVAGRAVATAPGLARIDNVPRNTMVVMATKADAIAEDGSEHSPFAAALLAHLQIPGLELSLFFRSVRDAVLRATNNRQEPYVFSSLGAEPFYFYPRPPNHPPVLGAIAPLQVVDTAGPTPLGISRPTDPDADPLTVRITGLPLAGEVRVAGEPVALNKVFSADQFMHATYKPDGRTHGAVGTLDILVEDGRGGAAPGSMAITVLPSRHPPVVDAPRTVQAFPIVLGIAPPTSPDGDAMTVTVLALPKGVVRNGRATVKIGDRLQPRDLPDLVFLPDPGVAGDAGSLRYLVEDTHGGMTEGKLGIEVATASDAAGLISEAQVWDTVRDKGDAAGLDAFLHLFPTSRYAEEARRRRDEAPAPGAATSPPAPAPAPAPAAPPGPVVADHAREVFDTKPVAAEPVPEPGKQFALAKPQEPPAPRPSEPPAQGGEPANSFQDCQDCPRLVRVPAGSFVMGQGARDPEAMPAHRVAIRAFALGAFPVTIAEWNACVAEAGCTAHPRMATSDGRRPVHNLSWDDAQQYVRWLSKTTSRHYRLPSEAEWEYAARAGSTSRYWWGNEIGVAAANCADCGGPQDRRAPLPVDGFKPNAFGLSDMLGGVAEWVADCWVPTYRGAPADGSARDAKFCLQRVLRGGSFRAPHDEIAVTARNFYDSSVRYVVNGFRVARDPD